MVKLSCLFIGFLSSATMAREVPNFILMNMDDLGWGDLGIFGEPNRETPNLDKMASDGMLFTNFYTAAPLCSPSRASMMTGRLPIRNGFYSDNAQGRNAYTPQDIMGGIADDEILLPELLKQKAGYRTKLVGKWHLGHRPQYHPLKHGFDEWFGAPNCHFHYGPHGSKGPNIPVYRDENMIGRYYESIEIDTVNGLSNYTQMLTQEAIKFIWKRGATNKPFFLYWAPDSTHAPSYAAPKFKGSSKRGTAYGDAIVELDSAVGEILNTLIHLGIANKTLVIFTSDNGAALVTRQKAGSNGPLLCGKQTTFEGGFRTPTIAWWPDTIKSRSTSNKAATQMDLFSTLVSLAGLEVPSDRTIDGVDLSKTLLISHSNEIDDDEHSIFFYRGNLLMAIRHGSYKMHLWTWTTPESEIKRGIDHCPDVCMKHITTLNQTDHRDEPILFHIERDPGERYPIGIQSNEYVQQVRLLNELVHDHEAEMVPGKPQLNWCDEAVMNWSPPGCELFNDCQRGPSSHPYRCFWEH